MDQKRLVLLCFLLAVALPGCALPGSRAAALEKELEEAFINYLAVTNEAQITFDTTELPNVSTGYDLQGSLDYIEMYKKLEAEGNAEPVHAAEEFKVEWVKVIASGSSWAVIEAKKSYLTFSVDLRTEKKTYANATRWRVQRYLFIKEDGVWKVDRILEGVSWSG
jgi:hypothetical protein